MSITIGLALDIVIIFLLALTLFYAIRLSAYLQYFRKGRDDIQRLFIDLTAHIDRAEDSMSSMRQKATESGTQLQLISNESRQLYDELKFMNEAGDNLASRLEAMVDRTRETFQQPAYTDPVPAAKAVSSSRPDKRRAPRAESFAIQDRDYIQPEPDDIMTDFLEDDLIWEDDAVFKEEDVYASYDDAPLQKHSFQSRAEEEFYNSLRKARLKGGVPEVEDAA